MESSADVIGQIIDDGIANCSYERKLELTKNRPTPFLNLHLVDGKTTRKFQYTWYSKYEWLTGSTNKSKLFCYCCLLFGGDYVWGVDGVTTVKNFERKANIHSISGKHLRCQEKFKLFGRNRIDPALSEEQRLAALKYNEQVGNNRRILSRLIQVVCYLGKQELTFRGRDESKTSMNKGNYLELLDLLSREEQLLKEHLSSNSCFKGVSGDIQSDLISCIAQVMNTQIMTELNKAKFVSIQGDETTDVSCESQMSIIFRYVVDSNIVERFIGFFDVSQDKTASGLSNILLEAIKKWNISDKIICQTYDGAVLMAEQQNDVQAIIKETYPNAKFIHCYAHQLNLVFLHGAKTIKAVRLFIGDLTMFRTFFIGSPKRSELLREKGFNLPKKCETTWNYHSRATATISAHFTELKQALLCVSEEEDWDPMSIALANGLLYKLSNFKFLYLICLFKNIFVFSDRVSTIVQTKCTAGVQTCINEITHMFTKLADMRNEETVSICIQSAIELNSEIQFSDDDVKGLNDLTFEILDSIITQTNVRFQDFYFLKFLEVTNIKVFKNYKECFPDEKLQELENNFPGVFDLQRLTNELTIIFEDSDKYLSPKELLNYIIKGLYIFF